MATVRWVQVQITVREQTDLPNGQVESNDVHSFTAAGVGTTNLEALQAAVRRPGLTMFLERIMGLPGLLLSQIGLKGNPS